MNRIKKILQEQGRSQKWLAVLINKSYVVVNNYVNNKAQPSISTLFHISHHLDVEVGDLLDHKALINPDQIIKLRVGKPRSHATNRKRGRPRQNKRQK
jgi:putative transcriptional regulator